MLHLTTKKGVRQPMVEMMNHTYNNYTQPRLIDLAFLLSDCIWILKITQPTNLSEKKKNEKGFAEPTMVPCRYWKTISHARKTIAKAKKPSTRENDCIRYVVCVTRESSSIYHKLRGDNIECRWLGSSSIAVNSWLGSSSIAVNSWLGRSPTVVTWPK
jgi:hypothetical protein